MLKFFRGEYVHVEQPTMCVDLLSKTMILDETRVQLQVRLLIFWHWKTIIYFCFTQFANYSQVWDTPGEQRFRTICPVNFRGAHGVILVYDVTNIRSFHSIHSWVAEVKQVHSIMVKVYSTHCNITNCIITCHLSAQMRAWAWCWLETKRTWQVTG